MKTINIYCEKEKKPWTTAKISNRNWAKLERFAKADDLSPIRWLERELERDQRAGFPALRRVAKAAARLAVRNIALVCELNHGRQMMRPR